VQQAKRARSVLRRALRSMGTDTSTLALRWVVATPECRLEAPGVPVLDAAQLWDALAADQLVAVHRRSCGELAGGERVLGRDGAARLAEQLRGRTREGSPTDRCRRGGARATGPHPHGIAPQRAAPLRLASVRVGASAAGTGKTVLAIEMAVQYASLGHRVLLGCWNVVLARWLRAAVRQELEAVGSPAAAEVTADPTGRVVVSHLVDLARHGDPPAPGDDEGTWYLETLPSVLTTRA
jgi:hypothetical protein